MLRWKRFYPFKAHIILYCNNDNATNPIIYIKVTLNRLKSKIKEIAWIPNTQIRNDIRFELRDISINLCTSSAHNES